MATLGDALTEREMSVLRGMAVGHSNGQIGRDLYLSEDTVKTHARRLFQKLGARDRAHAVHLGHAGGLLSTTSTERKMPPPADSSAPPPRRNEARVELRDSTFHVELCARAFYPSTISPTVARQRAQDGLRRLLGTAGGS